MVGTLQRAHSFAKHDYWFGTLFLSLPKYWFLGKAYRRAKIAREALAEFQADSASLGLEHDSQIEIDVDLGDVAVDWLDVGLGELFVADSIAANRRKANIALSRVRRVVRAFEGSPESGAPV